MDWIIKIAIAVAEMHINEIYHNDLKLDNVLMLNEFTPVLADFNYSGNNKILEDNFVYGT